MERFNAILNFIDYNFIFCLIPILSTLYLIERLFKNRFPTKEALKLVSWLMMLYTLAYLIYYCAGIDSIIGHINKINTIRGVYSTNYWITFSCMMFIPFSLLIKKNASNFLHVLLIAILMKIGFFMERYAIITGTFILDGTLEIPFYSLLLISIQGFIIAIAILFLLGVLLKLFKND